MEERGYSVTKMKLKLLHLCTLVKYKATVNLRNSPKKVIILLFYSSYFQSNNACHYLKNS